MRSMFLTSRASFGTCARRIFYTPPQRCAIWRVSASCFIALVSSSIRIGRSSSTEPWSPLSLAYYSRDPDSDLCVYSLLAARADPHIPSMERKLGDGFWTLARAVGNDEQADMLQKLKLIALRIPTIVHPKAAAEWIWSRISCVGVTTAVVESMLEYLMPYMYLHELVREVLTERAESPEDEETFVELYWQLAEQLLCASAHFSDDKAVELLLRQGTEVDSHDDSKRSAAPTHCQSLARFLTRPDRPAQVCTVVRRPPWQRAACTEAARRWRQVQLCR